MVSKRRVQLLVIALTVELGFAVVGRWNALDRLLHGDHGPGSVFAVVRLSWVLLVLVIAGDMARAWLRARSALYRKDQTIAAVGSTTHDWLWESDLAFTFTYHSPGVERLLGYRPEDLVGVSMGDLLADQERERAQSILADGLAQLTGWQDVDRLWRHRDGHSVVLRGSAAAIRDESGKAIGFRGTRSRVSDLVAEDDVLAIRDRVEQLLTSGTVEIALQPIASLFTGRLAGAEALARFPDGRGPDLWFEEAREAGMSRALDAMTFTAALASFAALPDTCYLSVNASPALILDPAFPRWLLDCAVPLERLVIEITEHVAIPDYPTLNTALAPMRERGVRLAVDDTGAGYASLRHVLQLRPDIIKIDRSLTAELSGDRARRSLVTALVLLALDIGATVTGEGVETPAELATLIDLGVDAAQGYLLARPTTDPADWCTWPDRNWAESVCSDLPRPAPQ
ncbi:MAG: hypothetical protein QOF82_2457 [Frankiales bacterium]|nr:hypothetical protein [Frankiales bacterium]